MGTVLLEEKILKKGNFSSRNYILLKGTFARGIILWGHIAQIVGNTTYIWNVT